MKTPTQPGAMRKVAPSIKGRRGRRKVKATSRRVYAVFMCAGCVSGCVSGAECVPALGLVHGSCLYECTRDLGVTVNLVKVVPAGKCLHCGKELLT